MLHIWTFLLLFVNARTFENVHGVQAHGPHALMKEHPAMPQVEAQAQVSPVEVYARVK
jgi:hypothetical protein